MSTIDLELFKKSFNDMIAKNDATCDSSNDYLRFKSASTKLKDYSLEEVDEIINSGDLAKQIKLSRNYFLKDGFYSRLIYHYATVLEYRGILIPNPSIGQTLSNQAIQKRYNGALNYIEKIDLPDLFVNCSVRALVDGTYYGVIQKHDKNELVIIDLPTNYCESKFKDIHGHDLIQFNVTYFDTILDEATRNKVLDLYPKMIKDHYNAYRKKKVKSTKITLPAEVGLCFTFPGMGGRPPLLSTVPAAIMYDEAVDTDREIDREEIKKIIVQQIPHLNDGQLVFEPDEALEMHKGTVGMMKSNKNVSVLTTYADVQAILSNSRNESANNIIEKMKRNFYYQAGASGEVFSPDGSLAIEDSLKNDMAFMMILANKYSRFVTYVINTLYANSNIDFKYTIMPITWYNQSDYITDTFKLAQSGYSFMLPALASGFSQKDFINIKDLENEMLKLNDKLIPLQSAYTQSSDSKTNEKKLSEESPKTIRNKETIDKTGGSK